MAKFKRFDPRNKKSTNKHTRHHDKQTAEYKRMKNVQPRESESWVQ